MSDFTIPIPPITDDLRRYFRFGMMLPWITRKTGIAHNVLAAMARNGLVARPSNCKQHYYCNADFFETIDTETKAYWLGFIYADGCIVEDRQVNILLAGYEKDHLAKYKQALEAEHPIEERWDTIRDKNRPVRIQHNVKIRVCSRKLVGDLIDKGCHSRKSTTLVFPTLKQVSEKMRRHFIRGYFDGDGSIWCGKDLSRGRGKWGVSIISTTQFCNEMMTAMIMDRSSGLELEDFSHQRHPNHGKNGMMYLQLCSFAAMNSFKDYIYKDATVFLDRKKAKFGELPSGELNEIAFVTQEVLRALRETQEVMGTKELLDAIHVSRPDVTIQSVHVVTKRLSDQGMIDVHHSVGRTRFYVYDFTEKPNHSLSF